LLVNGKASAKEDPSEEVESVSKQQSIHRSVALNASVEFMKTDIKHNSKDVVKVAETFYNFLENDEDPKE